MPSAPDGQRRDEIERLVDSRRPSSCCGRCRSAERESPRAWRARERSRICAAEVARCRRGRTRPSSRAGGGRRSRCRRPASRCRPPPGSARARWPRRCSISGSFDAALRDQVHDRHVEAFLVDLAAPAPGMPRPPISTTCRVQAKSATAPAPRKVGVTTTKSLRWPVPIQGSLVMKTSPGAIVVEREFPQHVADGFRHRVDVARRAGHRLRQHVAGAVVDAGGQVARLARRGAEAGAHQRAAPAPRPPRSAGPTSPASRSRCADGYVSCGVSFTLLACPRVMAGEGRPPTTLRRAMKESRGWPAFAGHDAGVLLAPSPAVTACRSGFEIMARSPCAGVWRHPRRCWRRRLGPRSWWWRPR